MLDLNPTFCSVNENNIKSVEEIKKLINKKDFYHAEKELLKVIKIKKNNYYAHFLLGNIFALIKKFENAIEQYEISNQLKPNNLEIIYNLGVMYGEKDELNKSKNFFEKVISLDNNDLNANLALAKIYERQNNYEQAKIFYKKTLSIKKDFILANQIYGKFLIKIGEINKGQYYNYKYSGIIRFNDKGVNIINE